MKYLVIAFFSFHCFALSQKDAQKLVHNYLTALKSKDSKQLQKVLSEHYYKSLNDAGLIKKIFNMQKKSTKKIDFDLKIKKAANEKDVYFLNIKGKNQKSDPEIWYRVKNMKIEGSRYFD